MSDTLVGGTQPSPTYEQLGDHSETVQIDYDPSVISYEELLDVFWQSHDPTGRTWSRQYMSIVFYHTEEQKQVAVQSKQRAEKRLGRKLYTEIVPFSEFYLAEEYHQKYRLRQVPLLTQEFAVIYPELMSFISSTAVARVNGYVGGNGSLAQLEQEVNRLGLSGEARELLIRVVSAWKR